jgi:hypothetical protein
MIIFAAPDAHMTENPGWGKLAFLVGAALLFWAFTAGHQRLMKLRNEGHSPASMGPPEGGVNPQVSDPVTRFEPPRGSGSGRGDDDLEVFVSTNLERLPRNELKRQAMALFRKSESTIKRRIREAREAREGVLPEDDEL